VNVTTGDGRHGDASPRKTGIPSRYRSCRRRESFEGQQAHDGEPCFATGGNVVNPMIGSGMQQGREVAEEETVEVVRNHEGGTPDGNWHSHPEGGASPAAMRARSDSRSADSTIETMEGRSLDNPKRGNPALRPGRKDRNASGKSAPRSGGSRKPVLHVQASGPVEGPRGPERGDVLEGRGGQQ
jgi:hypothetical protein